jgi:hypothetical protein
MTGMGEPLHQTITAPGAWRGPDIQSDTSWMIRLDDRDVAEVDAALAGIRARGLEIPFKRTDFPLPKLGAKIDEIPDRLENGVGFALVRGLPRERYSDQDCELIYWGFGVHLGRPVSQNSRGHLLGHVRDEGKTIADPTTRMYQTTLKLDFHSDQLPVDVLGLFCVRTAKEGGASFLVSALTVHNVLLAERPDLVDVLHRPFNLDWRGEEPAGEQPWYTSPMFSYHDGRLTSRITSRTFFESVTRFGEDLALTPIQREALDAVQEISERPELRLAMDFREGDMQFVNNHAILHAREEYEDHDDPALKRHLLRMWISLPEERRRRLSPELAGRYRYVEMGGIPKREAA